MQIQKIRRLDDLCLLEDVFEFIAPGEEFADRFTRRIEIRLSPYMTTQDDKRYLSRDGVLVLSYSLDDNAVDRGSVLVSHLDNQSRAKDLDDREGRLKENQETLISTLSKINEAAGQNEKKEEPVQLPSSDVESALQQLKGKKPKPIQKPRSSSVFGDYERKLTDKPKRFE